MAKEVVGNKIYFSKLKENAIIPNKADENAGYDIYACFDEDFILLKKFETKLIPTGIAWAASKEFYMQFYERSSTGTKGIKLSAGVIDSSYRGEFKVAVFNASCKNLVFTYLDEESLFEKYQEFANKDEYLVYNCKKAIAQGVVHKVNKMDVQEVSYDELQSFASERGVGGWGSSGK